MPLAAIVSILHRVSGVLLCLAIPLLLYCLQLSVASEQNYQLVWRWAHGWIFGFTLIVLLWALLHHLFAGIRFLLLDLDFGISREQINVTAALVVAVSLSLLLILLIFP